MGRDSDDPRALGEVGRVGVAIDSIDDMRTLLAGLPLDKISTSMTINSTAAILLCMYMAVAEENGVSRKQISGTIQNDLLKEYMARGTYIFPPRPSIRLITDIFGFCGREVPKWNTISISGYHIREAGCDAVQEVAFTLADGIAYVEAALKAGLDVDAFGAQLESGGSQALVDALPHAPIDLEVGQHRLEGGIAAVAGSEQRQAPLFGDGQIAGRSEVVHVLVRSSHERRLGTAGKAGNVHRFHA
jgi:hypothetical protein